MKSNLILSLNPKEAAERREKEFAAGEAVGCVPILHGTTLDDSYHCSCGWKSKPYWDGADLAHNDWLEHIKALGALLPKPA